jgi:transposase
MIYVGMDLHRKNSYVSAISSDGEEFPSRRIHHDEIEELWQYLDEFGDDRIRVAFESTGNARWMYRLLSSRPNVEPVMVTPHKVRIIAESVAKSDRVDAGVLAYLNSLDALPRSWVPDEGVEELRELTRHRAALVRRRTQAKNQVNGILTRCGLLRPYQDVFGRRGRAWLAGLTLASAMQHQLRTWLEELDGTAGHIQSVEGILYKHLLPSDRWREDVARLMTMPGVGKLTALTILAELGDYRRFRRRSQVGSFAGLVPKTRRSDGSARYGRLTKRGPRALRTILIEVSLSAARQSPRYGRLYQKLKAAGRANAGKAAVARQLLEDAWTILIRQDHWREMSGQAALGLPARAG